MSASQSTVANARGTRTSCASTLDATSLERAWHRDISPQYTCHSGQVVAGSVALRSPIAAPQHPTFTLERKENNDLAGYLNALLM